MIDYKESVKRLLGNVTQEQVDLWRDMNREKRIPVEDFVSQFDDFSRNGMITLLIVASMAPAKGDEKEEEGKINLYHKLATKRLKSEGKGDKEIEDTVVDNISKAVNVGDIVGEEIMNMKPKVFLRDAGKEKETRMLRDAIVAEYDAISKYEKFAMATRNPDVKELFMHVSQEEKVHIGEFEAKLNEIDPEHMYSTAEGEKEYEGRQ